MKRVIFMVLLALGCGSGVAQTKDPAPQYADVCHVYVLDREMALKAREELREGKLDEAAIAKKYKSAETLFAEFLTSYEEEELTVKHYPFPNSNQFITASVYYTDESMASKATKNENSVESMVMAIGVAEKKMDGAMSSDALNAAVSEITYNDFTNKIRVKQYLKVNNKTYLVGLECDCASKRFVPKKN